MLNPTYNAECALTVPLSGGHYQPGQAEAHRGHKYLCAMRRMCRPASLLNILLGLEVVPPLLQRGFDMILIDSTALRHLYLSSSRRSA